MSIPDFAAGDVFAGRYRMIARIGRGGMGDVWRADDLILETAVALELMHSARPSDRTRILQEVRLARRIPISFRSERHEWSSLVCNHSDPA